MASEGRDDGFMVVVVDIASADAFGESRGAFSARDGCKVVFACGE